MYCLLTLGFLVSSLFVDGDKALGLLIVAGLFSIADAICYTVNHKK